jgi:para-aminobenzoate synthetase/4-amino-4-deoxychorismate lyase
MAHDPPLLIFDFADAPANKGPGQRLVFLRPERVISARALREVKPALREVWNATRSGYYAAGFLCYEAGPAFDAAMRTHASGPLPLVWFGLFRAPADFAGPARGDYQVGAWQPATPRDAYDRNIAQIRAAIERGDTYQVNYTLRLKGNFAGDSLAWYGDLHAQSHGHFNAYIDIGPQQILSLSPELFFAWNGVTLAARPMKGTARRVSRSQGSAPHGRWPEEDQALGAELLASEKNRAENLMIVDLLRNDLARVATTGSVKVPHLFSLEGYATVYQLTSTITAETRPDATLEDILSALFPCGSITGAPKIKTMEIIAALEESPRGIYCGAIGYVTPERTAVFNVPIRTVVVDALSGSAECGVGGGITWDSTPADEYAETLTKARFLTARAPSFELLETLLLHDGRYAFEARHLDRMARSASHFGFRFERDRAAEALAAHAALHGRAIRRVRLLADAGGELRVESVPLDTVPVDWFAPQPNKDPLHFALAATAVDRRNPWLYHKTTARALYDAHTSRHSEAYDVLLWNEEGELTEFTRGNLVMELDGRLLTPPLQSGLLPGTLRAELLERRVITEAILHRDDLARAGAIWFINGVRGWVAVKIASL